MLKNNSIRFQFLLILIVTTIACSSGSKDDGIDNTAVREDFQSYMGYEENLAALYLTVPYDVTVGNNQQSRLSDIGILFAALLPLLLLWSPALKRRWRILLGFGLIAYLGLVSWYAVLIKPAGQVIPITESRLQDFLEEVSFKDGFFQSLIAHLYNIGQKVGTPIHNVLEQISGPTDYVTYPLMIALFTGLTLLLHVRLRHSDPGIRLLVLVIALYGFLWWLFSGGITWYGLLMIPVFYLLVAKYLLSQRNPLFMFDLTGKILFGGIVAGWGIPALILFLANLNYQTDTGKNLIDFPVALHAMGHLSQDEVVDAYFPGASRALKIINEDKEAVVLRAGTMLSFYIDRNHERVYSDDLLDFFNLMYKHFDGDRDKITRALKASDIRYFIFSLKIGASDRTPEGTLREKFRNFLRFLYQHPDIQLMVTDNLSKVKDPVTGKEVIRPGIFGTPHRQGTFCIMRLNN